MLGSLMRIIEQCLRIIIQHVTPRLPATMSPRKHCVRGPDVTALAIIKPKEHKRLADPLLQLRVVTRINRVYCVIKSKHKSILQNL